MNYQMAPFWFYSGKFVLLVLLAVGSAFTGVTAPIFYGLLAGLVMPVVISMRLHQLAEKCLVVIPKDLSQWTVYVHGIPVQETRNTLTNPCFAIRQQLRAFFLRAFAIKLLLQCGALILLISQVWPFRDIWIILGIGLLVALWLLLKCVETCKLLAAVVRQMWLIAEIRSGTDSIWYCAGFGRPEQQIAALEKLLAI
ncbi:hypothetical protein [Serratia sp. (in: enterobacteria)]|uniref:hypothetical protein n=1 Tax=Serratia sp. (in: enterobacteria) TaxID=616 RepID=UPI003989F1F5